MQLPLKVNLGFKLHLWRSADLCLISFRCWVAPVCSGEGGVGLPVGFSSVGDSFTHAHTLTRIHTHTHILLLAYFCCRSLHRCLPVRVENRATFVLASPVVSRGHLQHPYDNTQPFRGEQRQMEKLIYD